jgi:Leucine-rich repeat (LRR) protein
MFTCDSLIGMIQEFKTVTTSTESNRFEPEDLPCYELEEAICENNQITQLSICNTDCRFVGQWPNIRELSLFLFPTLKTGWKLFKMFPNLESLNIKNQKSSETSQYDLLSIFAHGESLKRLQIRVNSTDCIEKLARCFPQLAELDLSYSRNMHTIGPNEFSNFPFLKKLNLSNCSIKNIDPGAFNHILLDELDLSENRELKTLQFKGPALPRVFKAMYCDKLRIVKLLDFDSPTLPVIHELSMQTIATASDLSLESPSRLFANIRVLSIKPTCGMSFDPFVGLEKLTLRINKFGDLKGGQLESLVLLKEFNLDGNDSRNGLFF